MRKTLRKAACRHQNASENSMLADSHTTYFNLTLAEKDERMHYSLVMAKQKNKLLETRVSKLTDKSAP